ncbi:cellulose biosynthesis cyclic di-GMP-binding regulatory protein BcsB [Oceanimonas doudoroffii]|uniref:Cyclic di-GMP-binding protein n=1 Tax=Oceanimonas doudoroffii TaxID=84158 RepID=A0A233RJ50_9GAMM|nr:cellulose biosynthesis cyclic di-GMP-binding regulatory protein BcsB [Oceanimonas doudoroffii]OXY83413.1 cellulose synthase regulator BcsB [Oceanimonas doudoroffii]
MSRLPSLLITSLAMLLASSALAQVPSDAERVSTWTQNHGFDQLAQNRDMLLRGVKNTQQITFGLRRDRLARDAALQLAYTPSPALLPTLSHLRVYLNEVLMDTLVIEPGEPGRLVEKRVRLDPRLITDFNQVRIEFVGHYQDICEDPAHSALWLNLAKNSRVELTEQALALSNDLSHFPLPFFDRNDNQPLQLDMVLAREPGPAELQAAGVLASYFGSLAGWRSAGFEVSYDSLPAVGRGQPPGRILVLATNERRPAFMRDNRRFPPVKGAEVRLMGHPDDSLTKLLLVQGEDDEQLGRAVRALALGGKLLRGERAVIEEVQPLAPRQPYDAPNWTPTDRPVRFAELVEYPGQLRASGLIPEPVELTVRLPPDLFVWQNEGIPLQTRYRYTTPSAEDDSRLNISLNGEFIGSLPLNGEQGSQLERLRLAVTANETTNAHDRLMVPSIKIGARNVIRYDFNFATTFGSAQPERCQTTLVVDSQAVIDENSSIDFSGYYHFKAMPDLSAFVHSGFPFSRMADLSDTMVLMPEAPSPLLTGLMLDTLARISAHTGYPAMALQVTHKAAEVRDRDADWLVFGQLPAGMEQAPSANLEPSAGWLLQAANATPVQAATPQRLNQDSFAAEARVTVSAAGPLAALVGMESPYVAGRSLVALLGNGDQDYELLRQALHDEARLGDVFGSLALVRESGVHSQLVGEQYFVGYLPWWLKLWYLLSPHPVWLALLSALGALLLAVLLWRSLRWLAHRRELGDED